MLDSRAPAYFAKYCIVYINKYKLHSRMQIVFVSYAKSILKGGVIDIEIWNGRRHNKINETRTTNMICNNASSSVKYLYFCLKNMAEHKSWCFREISICSPYLFGFLLSFFSVKYR